MMTKLFLYYSFTNNGEIIANLLKEEGIETYKVEPIKALPKNLFLSMMVGGFLSLIHHKPKLKELNIDLSKYDAVIIGSPIWNDRLSTPINSVLNSLSLKDKQLTFILYSGGGKCKKAIKFINKYYPSSKIVEIKEPKNNKDLALILKNNNII